jgi:Zn-dependent protease
VVWRCDNWYVEYYSSPASQPREPYPAPPQEPYIAPPLEPERKTLRNRIGGAVAALAVLLGKFKSVLLLLPKLKVLSTSATMLVSVGAYALIWGWRFAAGFVLLLFVHEMGHVIQLRREGIRATAPLFIPFMGAFVGMKQLPSDAAAEARVGLAGPVLGSLGCLVPLILWRSTGDVFFQALAFTGFFLNLFNLLPVLPLDGGRAMAALSPWMWIIGFGLLVGAAIAFPNPIMILILVLGGMETLRRWRTRKTPAAQIYHRVPGRQRALIAVVYLGLAVALAFGMDVTHVVRTFSDV